MNPGYKINHFIIVYYGRICYVCPKVNSWWTIYNGSVVTKRQLRIQKLFSFTITATLKQLLTISTALGKNPRALVRGHGLYNCSFHYPEGM